LNKQLLEATLADAGVATVDEEVDNMYRLLTSDGVNSGSRTETRQRLKKDDIDIDNLTRDFVTYQAIRSYLKQGRGASYDGEEQKGNPESVVDTLQQLNSRC
jgi:hypothetical protein